MLSRLVAMLCLLLLVSIGLAQEVTPPITAENATQLVPVQTVGSALPGKLAFSPDGRYILASTSEQTNVYEADQPTAAPKILPFTDFSFDTDERLVADGQYWNLDTGLSLGIAPTIRVLPPTENQSDNLIELVKPGGAAIQVDTGFPYQVLGTAVSDDYNTLAVVMRVTEPEWLEPALYLYNLGTGSLYAVLPQNIYGGSLQNLTFIEGSTILIAEFFWDRSGDGDIFIYDASTGTLLTAYSGESDFLSQRSWDGKKLFYSVNQSEIVILGGGLTTQIPYIPWGERRSAPPYAVGEQYLAIVDGSLVKVTDLYDATAPQISLAFDPSSNYPSAFYFTKDDRWLIYLANPVSYVWDLQVPHSVSLEINSIEGTPHKISPDLTRYAVRTPYYGSNKLIIFDAMTNETLAELPSNAVLDDNLTQSIYWQSGAVVQHDIINHKNQTFTVMENYPGNVRAFNRVSATVAFTDEQLTLVTVPDARVLPVELSALPDSITFTADGESFLVFRESRGENSPASYLTIRATSSGEVIRELVGERIYGARVISPTGQYVLDDYGSNVACRGAYSFPALRLFSSLPGHGDNGLLFVDGSCDHKTMAFTEDDSIFYAGAYSNVFAFQLDTINEPVSLVYDDPGLEFSILNYPSSGDYSQPVDSVRGVVLSANQQRLAVIVDRTMYLNSPLDIRIEVFDLKQLPVGTQRESVQPLITIPDASMAVLSPDGNSIVTNTGLFTVASGNKAEVVKGTIGAFTSDSQLLATYQNGYVNLWNVNNPSNMTFPLAQYGIKGVKELAFSPDNRYLYLVRQGDVQMWGVK